MTLKGIGESYVHALFPTSASFFFFFLSLYNEELFIWVFYLHICLHHLSAVLRGQKRALDLLQQESQAVVGLVRWVWRTHFQCLEEQQKTTTTEPSFQRLEQIFKICFYFAVWNFHFIVHSWGRKTADWEDITYIVLWSSCTSTEGSHFQR